MRPTSTHVVLTLAVTAALPLAGCSKSSKKSSSTTTSAVQSNTNNNNNNNNGGGTGAITTGTGTIGGSTSGGITVVGGGSAGGGNTSSGGSNTGATPAGFQGGTGTFLDFSALLPNSTSQDYGADATDLDGDGDVDIVIASRSTDSRILFNNGQQGFAQRAGAFPAIAMQATDVRAVDVDKDGDMDLLFSSNFEPVRLFVNNGQGVFTLAQEFNTGNDCYTYNLAIGDADKDGDEDVFVVNAGQATPSKGQNKLFLNTNGRFAEAPAGSIPVKFDDSLDATFLDVDADGDVDIFVANFGTTHSLLINDGTGHYVNQADVWLPPGLTRYGTAIGQADMNNDGKIDLFVANEGPSVGGALPAGEQNSLLIQTVGKFEDQSATRVPGETEPSFAVRLVDVNGDGWQDVLISNLRAVQRLYLNQQGVLVDATANFPAVNQTAYDSLGLTIGDFNGDRAPDVLFVRRGQKPWLFLNVP